MAAFIGATPIAAGDVAGRPSLQPITNPSAPLDETGDSTPDVAETLAQRFSRRAEAALVAQQSEQQQLQLRLDRVRASFNASQEMRAERQRQANALRDMAIEQAKKDDEILKKYIAMI